MEIEYGTCDICGKERELERHYYYYGIKCECHSPEHFEVVSVCKECLPIPPKKTLVEIKPVSYSFSSRKYQTPIYYSQRKK